MLIADARRCIYYHLYFNKEHTLQSEEYYHVNKLRQFELLNELWVWDNVKFKLEERIIKSLHKSTLKYIVDKLFYPTKSKYISIV